MRALALTFVLLGLLAGCGQKGPLVLPEQSEAGQEQAAD